MTHSGSGPASGSPVKNFGHAVGNGTDGTSGWLLLVVAGCVVAVAAAVAWRLSGRVFEPDAPVLRVAPPADLAGLR